MGILNSFSNPIHENYIILDLQRRKTRVTFHLKYYCPVVSPTHTNDMRSHSHPSRHATALRVSTRRLIVVLVLHMTCDAANAAAVSLTPALSVVICAMAPAATAVGFACSPAAAARGRHCQCGHSRTRSGCTRSTHSRTLRGPADDAAAVVLESARPYALQPCALRPCALWPYALRTCFGRARSAR